MTDSYGIEHVVPRVLLVEDNPGDIRLVREALHATRVRPVIDVVRTGNSALDHIACIRAGTVPEPWLVLLDLNLPGVGGLTVLELLKTDERVKPIPVVVLTSSGAYEDVEAAYRLGANCYLRKPNDPEESDRLFEAVAEFWLEHARLLSRTRSTSCRNT